MLTDSEMRQQVCARTCTGCRNDWPISIYGDANSFHDVPKEVILPYKQTMVSCTANVALADLVIRWVREARQYTYRRYATRLRVWNDPDGARVYEQWAAELEADAQEKP